MIRMRVLCMVLVALIMGFSPAVFAQEGLNETAQTAMKGISDIFSRNLGSSQSLGTPVEAGDYVIIPVVCKVAGFGFGTKLEALDKEVGATSNGKLENKSKDRLGLGGGGFVKPIALIFVKKGGDFKVVKLNEGFFSSLAKSLVPAMAGMIKDAVKGMAKMHWEKMRGRGMPGMMGPGRPGMMGPGGPQIEREKKIIIRKKLEKEVEDLKKEEKQEEKKPE